MMIHHPFRRVETLLLKDIDQYRDPETDEVYDDYYTAYRACVLEHIHRELEGVNDGLGELDEAASDFDKFDAPQPEEEDNDLHQAEFAGQRPGRQVANLEDEGALGRREVDRAYDWSAHVNTYPNLTFDWWNEQKTAYPKNLEVDYASQDVVDSLNTKQRQIYDLVMTHYDAVLSAEDTITPQAPQLLLHIDGKAGTSKSFVIKTLSAHLQQRAASAQRRNPVQRCALTGVASHGIQGRTLYALLWLPIKSSAFQSLKPADLQSVQVRLRNCKYLICDEKSIISLRVMYQMDQRCRQIFSNKAEQPFGGLNILLIGDFFQLPPVRSLPLFNDSNKLKNKLDTARRVAYYQFNQTIELDEIVRQRGANQEPFRQALDGLRNNTVTHNHQNLLTTRVQA